jgi:hypothetical protein
MTAVCEALYIDPNDLAYLVGVMNRHFDFMPVNNNIEVGCTNRQLYINALELV